MKHVWSGLLGFGLGLLLASQSWVFSRIPNFGRYTTTDIDQGLGSPSVAPSPLTVANLEPLENTRWSRDRATRELGFFSHAWRKLSSTNLPTFKVKLMVEEVAKLSPNCSLITFENDTPEARIDAQACFRALLDEIWRHPDLELRYLLMSQVLDLNYSDFPEIVTSEFQRLLTLLAQQRHTVNRSSMYLAKNMLSRSGNLSFFADFTELKLESDGKNFFKELIVGFRLDELYTDPELFVEALQVTWAMIGRAGNRLDSVELDALYKETTSRFVWRLKVETKDYQNQVHTALPPRMAEYVLTELALDDLYLRASVSPERLPASELAQINRQRAQLDNKLRFLWKNILREGL